MLTLIQFFHMNQEVTLKETLNYVDRKDRSYKDTNHYIAAPIHHPPSALLSNIAVPV